MRTGKFVMISFLGCDRISRTAGGKPHILAARSSCSSATLYGLGLPLAMGGRVIIRGISVIASTIPST